MTQAAVFLLLAGGFVACLFWLSRYGRRIAQQADAARAERANKLGWHYDVKPRGTIEFTLRATSGGIAWEYEYDDDSGSENPSPRARWSTAVQAHEAMFLIAGRRTYEMLRGLGGKIAYGMGKILSRSVGGSGVIEEEEFLKDSRELPVGSARFRKHFVTVAREGALASALIDARAESLLMDWPADGKHSYASDRFISIWATARGMRIDVSGGLTDMPRIERVVEIGVLLASRYREYLARFHQGRQGR